MSVFCSISERIHSNPPEQSKFFFYAFKNMNKSNKLINQACPILQKSRYLILLICTGNWAFMMERNCTAKGTE